MRSRLFLFGVILILISSCNRNLNVQKSLEEIPFTIDCNSLTHQAGQGSDSKIGTIVCDEISLSYDYGLYSNSKPESMIESFSKSFYAYHYSKFFDAIYMDERMREILKDSVQIVEVTNDIIDEKYIANCNECNSTAYLIFNNTTYFYPFILNDNIVENYMMFDFEHIELDQFYKKIYLSKEGRSSGVFIAPLGKPRKNRSVKKLSVVTNDHPSTELKKILESIELK